MPELPKTQEELDQLIQTRIARAREKWEKEDDRYSAIQAELEQARAEVADLKSGHQREKTEDHVRKTLVDAGHSNDAKNQRIIKLMDLSSVAVDDNGVPLPHSLKQALTTLQGEVPELFSDGSQFNTSAPDASAGHPSRQSHARGDTLTEKDINEMSPDEINSNWDRVKAFLSGQQS